MKRLISLVLICCLLFSSITVPAAATELEKGDRISPEMVRAYLGVIESIIDKYGQFTVHDRLIENDETGLYYADIIDFDGDGQMELYLLYKKEDYTQTISIWRFENSQAYLIGESDINALGTMTDGEYGLKKIGDKVYLCEESTGYMAGDMVEDKQIYVENLNLNVKEVKGKTLRIVINLDSSLQYADSHENMLHEEYSSSENGDNRKIISKQDYEKDYNKYSLAAGEAVISNSSGAIYFYKENFILDDFIKKLRDNLMSSNMKDIYAEKSREEKMAITDFLNNFRFFHSGEFDMVNPDQAKLAGFMRDTFSMHNIKIGEESIKKDDYKYGERWQSMDAEERESLNAHVWKCKEAIVNKKAEELFGINIDFARYLPDDYADGYVYMYTRFDAPELFVTKINKMYSLGNDLFYLDITSHGYFCGDDYDFILSHLFEELPNDITENFYSSEQGYAIVKEVIRDGKPYYQLIKYNKGEHLTEERLNKYVAKVNPNPNITFGYSKVKDFKEGSQYVDFFKEVIAGLKGEKPNDRANGEIVTYVQYAIESSGTTAVNSGKNKIIIDKAVIEQATAAAEKTMLEFNRILESNSITLNKSIDIVLRVNSQGLDSSEAMSVMFDNSIIEAMGAAKGIRIILGDNQHTVYISGGDLKNIVKEIENISVNIQKDNATGVYTIVFMDGNGTKISQLPHPISLSLPADNELATVFVSYKGGSDNWGGQYSSAAKSIEFSTRYSGEYSILENEINISDIGDLTEKQQRAIKFMVSKDYFGLDGDKFKGDNPVSRYDFTKTLVKIFFALDRELKTTFTDVEESNEYYPYIASGQKGNIVKGFEDNTFKGEINITKEQLIALCGRTLADKKGYIYPENPKGYLNFADNDSIAGWAVPDMAIAVQNGLIDNGGILLPQTEISRSEAAEILYKLFMLLYDVPPVAVDFDNAAEATADSAEEKESGADPAVVMGGLLSVLAIIGGCFYFFKKKSTAKM